jgi:DNA-binding transcriptional MerR regulator
MALKLVADTLDGLAPEISALYSKNADGKFALGVDGIEDTSGLKSALQKERSRADEAIKAMKQWDGLDATQIRDLLSQFESDDEAKLIAAGKIETVIERRNEKLKAETAKKLHEADDKIKAAEKKAQKWNGRVLDNQVREAATKAGIHSNAIDDALLSARNIFELDAEGNAIQLKDGKPVLGKDGSTPFSPSEWFESIREAKPHWWPATATGGGATQSKSGGGGADLSKLSPVERMNAARAQRK